MMDKLISIIVPVYNKEKTLERCVSSLLAQTHRNLEIILVNDGSKDNSLSVCYELASTDSRIRVVDKPNGGVSSARNAGLDSACGDYIMFCDSDDWVEPDWCECLYRFHRQGNLTLCEIAMGEALRESDKECMMEEVERKYYLHYPALMCSPCNKLFERQIIEQHKLRFMKELNLGEDLIFSLRYLSALTGKVCIVHRELYNYDMSTDGSLSKRTPSLEQCVLFHQMVFEAMKKLNVQDSQSYATASAFVTGHFAKVLISVSEQRNLSIREKVAFAGEMSRMESFAGTCGHGLEWENPVFLWFYRKNYLKMAMLFLILRDFKHRMQNG